MNISIHNFKGFKCVLNKSLYTNEVPNVFLVSAGKGKTSLLEALYLIFNKNSTEAIYTLMKASNLTFLQKAFTLDKYPVVSTKDSYFSIEVPPKLLEVKREIKDDSLQFHITEYFENIKKFDTLDFSSCSNLLNTYPIPVVSSYHRNSETYLVVLYISLLNTKAIKSFNEILRTFDSEVCKLTIYNTKLYVSMLDGTIIPFSYLGEDFKKIVEIFLLLFQTAEEYYNVILIDSLEAYIDTNNFKYLVTMLDKYSFLYDKKLLISTNNNELVDIFYEVYRENFTRFYDVRTYADCDGTLTFC